MEEKLFRVSAPQLDEILGYAYKVLDDGFIRVVDYMGSDESIVQAARVSYGKGTKILSEDRGLIRYLLRHMHTTPFEMCEIKLHVRVPMDCWRQWIRHRTANVNEYSTRYSLAIDSAQKTKKTEWRNQSATNKQGSAGSLDDSLGAALSEKEELLHQQIREIYDERIKHGVAREQARKDLPLSTYTEAYWKIDLHNLFHFLALRMDSHAQFEIRSYAEIIGNEIVSKWCPIAWEGFLDYRLGALSLSKIELELIKKIESGNSSEIINYAIEKGFISDSGEMKPSRERQEFEAKLRRLNISVPWKDSV
ncbi:MAG: FAD-dependent thymidylate synthase [Flavisolibacter sp.]